MTEPKPLPGESNDKSHSRGAHKSRAHKSRARDAGDGNASEQRTSSDRQHDRLTALLEQFGGGGFRLLAERLDNAGEPEYLGPVPFDVDLYETVRQRWGGGRYAGRIVDERSKYKARIAPFRIGGVPRNDSAANVPATGQAATGLEGILAAINANLAALAKQAAPAVDPVDHIVKIARAIKETSQTPVVAATVDPFEQMRNMLALLNELRENSGVTAPESSFGLVMKEGIAPLVQVFNRKLDIDEQRETRRRGGTSRVTARVDHGGGAVGNANEETVIPDDELEALLLTIPTPARRFLLGCAENEEDAEDYVPMLLNKLSDEAYEAMRRNLPRADFLDVLIKVVPVYGQHREWFSSLVDALRETVAAAAATGDGGQAEPLTQGVEA